MSADDIGMRHDPDAPNGLPFGMTAEQAEEMAAEANSWYACLQRLQPTPPTFDFRIVPWMVDGKLVRMVRVNISTITGVTAVFLPADSAVELAAILHRFGTEARSGITTAPAGAIR